MATMDQEMAPERLRELLREHYLDSFGWAVHCCRGDREEAAEVMQTACLEILEGKARFGARSEFKTWLFGVIRNTSANLRRRLLRRLKRLTAAPLEERRQGPVAERVLHQAQLAEYLGGLMSRLSPRQRDLLHLVFYQEMTVEEAAGVLGISAGSARVHYQRGKKRLKRFLEEAEENHERSWLRQDSTAL